MRITSTMLVARILCALALVGCKDGAGPEADRVVPASMDKIDGDGQQAVRGDPLPAPLRVRVIGSDGEPMAHASVQWETVAGAATLDRAASTTGKSGEAETRVTTVASIGTILVSAVAPGVTPEVFSIEGLNPCLFTNAPYLPVGSMRSGVLAPLDCGDEDFLYDLFRFTVNTQQAVVLRQRSPGYDPRLEFYPGSIWFYYHPDTVNARRDAQLKVIVPPGTYGLVASMAEAGSRGAYEIGALPAPESQQSCELTLALMGITTSQSLASTDCQGPAGEHADRFKLVLLNREPVTLLHSSSAFAPALHLMRDGELVATVRGTAPGTIRLDYVSGELALYEVIATSADPGRTGEYTLDIQRPTNVLADVAHHPVATQGVSLGPRRTIGAGRDERHRGGAAQLP